MSAGFAMLGTCPYLAAPCRSCCGYLVDGVCRFFGDPRTPIADCTPANPREWYLETLNSLAGGGL